MVCGDVGELTCASDAPEETCKPMSKWVGPEADPTLDDHYTVEGKNSCEEKNPGTQCKGTGDKPVFSTFCR